MLVGPTRAEGADVEMLFGQVSITAPLVDWGGTCGNLTAAVAAFAVDHGLVAAVEPTTEVRIFSINTGKRIVARVPVRHGRALSQGDYETPGVPGTAARIDLEYVDPAGSYSGRLLPTGKPSEAIELEDGRQFSVSIVDAANPVVFCDARELSLRGTELPAELEARRDVMATLEAIRCVAAERLGIVADRQLATIKSPGLPKIGFVAEPAPYATLSGEQLIASRIDLVGRLMSMQTAHRAYMGTGAVCTAAAAMIDGTVVRKVAVNSKGELDLVRIGHPYGVMDVQVRTERRNGETAILSATIGRTARRIMEGVVFVPKERFTAPTAA
jgi:2-methylaconitate cis-trans-isomerase PrpF